MSRARDLANLGNNAGGLETLTVSDITDITATADELNLVDGSVSGPLSHRNMIINGAMNIHQRGGSTSFAHDGTVNGYSLDRFRFTIDNSDEWDGTVQQHTMTSAELNTTGFAKAYKLTTGTAESAIASNESAYISQIIEAQNLQHLRYGTASAKTITLSFWAKASVTGTYAIGLYKPDTNNRVINKTYTVSDTNWNQYTVTFPGDTDSGAVIANDNAQGLYVNWHLAVGSDNNDGANTSWENYSSGGWGGGHAQDGIITTASATFYLTGVQLELGSVATPFEHRSYADELTRCHRYCVVFGNGANGCTSWIVSGAANGTNTGYFQYRLPVWPRSTPTIAISGEFIITDNYQFDRTHSSGITISTQPATSEIQGRVYLGGFTTETLTTGRVYAGPNGNGGTGKTTFAMEL